MDFGLFSVNKLLGLFGDFFTKGVVGDGIKVYNTVKEFLSDSSSWLSDFLSISKKIDLKAPEAQSMAEQVAGKLGAAHEALEGSKKQITDSLGDAAERAFKGLTTSVLGIVPEAPTEPAPTPAGKAKPAAVTPAK